MSIEILLLQLAGFALLPIFWVPIIITLLILWSFVVYEKGGFATFFTIVFGVMVAAKFPAVIAFVTNPIYMVAALVAYSIIGVLWARYKWSSLLNKKVEQFVAMRNKFLMVQKLPLNYFKTDAIEPDDIASKADQLQKFIKYALDNASFSVYSVDVTTMQALQRAQAPQASKNKGAIVMWIAYWPISVIWFICADLFRELGHAIYRAVGGHFQKMSDAKFDSI